MKNENVYMQDLHHKLHVVLVQILPYNTVQKEITAFARIRGFHPQSQTPLAPHFFFALPPLPMSGRPAPHLCSYMVYSILYRLDHQGCYFAVQISCSQAQWQSACMFISTAESSWKK